MDLREDIASDLDELAQVVASREPDIRLCTAPHEAAALFREGEELERKIRIARAEICAQRDEFYQTGFLLRAFAADLPSAERSRITLDVQG